MPCRRAALDEGESEFNDGRTDSAANVQCTSGKAGRPLLGFGRHCSWEHQIFHYALMDLFVVMMGTKR